MHCSMKGSEELILQTEGGQTDLDDESISRILKDDLEKPRVTASSTGDPTVIMNKASQIIESNMKYIYMPMQLWNRSVPQQSVTPRRM